MKKIKISEQQANMLQELGKTKVLKVTKEQYNKILEAEILAEGDVNMDKHFKGKARQEFKNTKVPGLRNEVYEAFINELYGNDINEGSEPVYEKLIKLMEVAGLINNGRLVKEKFKGDKNIVKEIISMGLHEMYEGGNEYSATNIMEDLVNSEDAPINGNEDYGFIGNKVKNWLDKYNNEYADGNVKYIASEFDKGNYKSAYTIIRDKFEGGVLKEGEVENPEGIVGLDILKYPPMSQLKKNRRDKGTEVRTINLPSIHSLDGYRTIHSQSEFTGYNTENSLGKVIGFKGYIQKFKDMFKEEPIFEIKSNGTLDFDIINPIYVKAKHNDSHGIPVEQDVDEATVAGSANTGGSSGPVVAPLLEPIRREGSNVVHELISDDVEIETLTSFRESVADILKIVETKNPNNIVKNEKKLRELAASVVNHDDKEDNVINQKLPLLKRTFSNMIKTLIYESKKSLENGITKEYDTYLKDVIMALMFIKNPLNYNKVNNINEEGVQNSGQYDTPGFDNPSMTGDTPRGKGPTWKKPTIAGGKEVKVKEKCSEFPYCDQGPDAIEINK